MTNRLPALLHLIPPHIDRELQRLRPDDRSNLEQRLRLLEKILECIAQIDDSDLAHQLADNLVNAVQAIKAEFTDGLSRKQSRALFEFLRDGYYKHPDKKTGAVLSRIARVRTGIGNINRYRDHTGPEGKSCPVLLLEEEKRRRQQ